MAEYDRNTTHIATSGTRAQEIDAGLRSYMLGVYNYMGLGIAFTAIITLFMANQPALMQAVALGPMKWVLFIGVLGLGWFSPKLIFSGNTALAHACYWVYAGLWGLLISPMVAFYLGQNPGVVFQAFLSTSVVFGAMSLYGYTTKRNLSAFATFFFMATIGLLVVMLLNVFFFQSGLLSLLTSGGVVLIFSGITAYETQMIKESYSANDDGTLAKSKSIFGAFLLYGSFITLFIHILNLLGALNSE